MKLMTRIGPFALVFLAGCGQSAAPSAAASAPNVCGQNLEHRAYILSRDSGDLTVLDLDCLAITGDVKMGTQNAHMAEMTRGFDEVYVSSTNSSEVVVVDARTLLVKARVNTGRE